MQDKCFSYAQKRVTCTDGVPWGVHSLGPTWAKHGPHRSVLCYKFCTPFCRKCSEMCKNILFIIIIHQILECQISVLSIWKHIFNTKNYVFYMTVDSASTLSYFHHMEAINSSFTKFIILLLWQLNSNKVWHWSKWCAAMPRWAGPTKRSCTYT